MRKYTAQELFGVLNETDECAWIEAKGIGDSSTSIMETVCSYSNEPDLGGGYILMSISVDGSESADFRYKVDPIPDPDKLQSDLATQCASMFNMPVRPKITIEKINGLQALRIWVDELPSKLKPLYFKKEKLPYGAMRRMMDKAHLVPPTFESSRENNEFTSRLLLHHFLDVHDLEWLKQFENLNLSDCQKMALIFVREIGAIDNPTYRQMADCDIIKASSDLKELKRLDLLFSKGKSKATYYIAGDALSTQGDALSTQGDALSTQGDALSTQGDAQNTHYRDSVVITKEDIKESLLAELPDDLRNRIISLNKRENNPEVINNLIMELCALRPYKSNELAILLNKREDYIRKHFLNPLLDKKHIKYLIPEMLKHPGQAYSTNK